MKTTASAAAQEQQPAAQGISAYFSPDNIEKLTSLMYVNKVKAGAYLFWDGDPAEYLYYVKSGRVKLTKMTDNGSKITLYLHHTGDMFGQIDPFQQSVQSFNAEVIEDAEIGIIQQKDLETMLWQHGDLAIEFMKWMGVMHRMTQTKFRDLLLYGKPGALCSLIIRLGNSYGTECEDGIRIDKKITNSEMAEMIGATRESVNRILSDLRRADAITVDNGSVLIKDLKYLQNICKCENCPKDICRV
ncbi:Crp/Fnr family transcriptional regulator [Paenibacillus daejeonensis]|uniref:Crp/Fnr family transcriptional regulator n=1 Tax=Paenibacillus daejeonensis TaxID=135193 RepID=UPI0003791DCF|nr:Crp/Fnr family transcriptional regulator [Paenibacillus daejeonensis]